jgi:protein CpxP
MKKESLLITLIVLLLVLNFGTLAFLFFSGRGHHHAPPFSKGGPAQMIIKELNLDEQQQDKFSNLREQHHSSMVLLDTELEETAKSYLSKLVSSDTSDVDSLRQAIGRLEMQRASVTYQHFKDLRSICNAEQQEKFEALLPELFRILTMPPPPKR